MWDDVQIGHRAEHMASAMVLNDFISHNLQEYWISLEFLKIGMRISKDTADGKRLEDLLANKVPEKDIEKWLVILALEHIDPVILIDKIECTIRREREDAARMKTSEIREVLGLGHI